MSAFDFLLHLVAFCAPACFLALLLGLLGARTKGAWLPWYAMALVHAVVGVGILTLGMVLSGHDGRMGTYAALVVALASCQWLLLRGWRRL